MQDMYTKIDEADNIIVASPINFAELTGSLLSWASRLQYLWVSRHIRNDAPMRRKKRYGALILVDGSYGYKDIALSTGKRLLRSMGTEFKGLVYFSGTDKLGAGNPLDDAGTMRSIVELAGVLNRENR
jgi:multimeric flavodoxin WrbA